MTLRKRRGGGLRASIVRISLARISLARISLAGISLAGMNGGVASVVVYSATRIPTQNARRETPIFFLSTRAVHDNPSFNHSLAHEKFAVRMSLRVPRSSSCSSAWAGTALSRVMRQSARSSVCRLRRSVATLMLYARKEGRSVSTTKLPRRERDIVAGKRNRGGQKESWWAKGIVAGKRNRGGQTFPHETPLSPEHEQRAFRREGGERAVVVDLHDVRVLAEDGSRDGHGAAVLRRDAHGNEVPERARRVHHVAGDAGLDAHLAGQERGGDQSGFARGQVTKRATQHASLEQVPGGSAGDVYVSTTPSAELQGVQVASGALGHELSDNLTKLHEWSHHGLLGHGHELHVHDTNVISAHEGIAHLQSDVAK
eukprot:scaffold908_cov228-Pinguiococcus_pyrenoidosus.AAC.4